MVFKMLTDITIHNENPENRYKGDRGIFGDNPFLDLFLWEQERTMTFCPPPPPPARKIINSRNVTRNFVFSAERRFWAQFREIQSAFPEVRGGCVRRLRIRSVLQSTESAWSGKSTTSTASSVSGECACVSVCVCVCNLHKVANETIQDDQGRCLRVYVLCDVFLG